MIGLASNGPYSSTWMAIAVGPDIRTSVLDMALLLDGLQAEGEAAQHVGDGDGAVDLDFGASHRRRSCWGEYIAQIHDQWVMWNEEAASRRGG